MGGERSRGGGSYAPSQKLLLEAELEEKTRYIVELQKKLEAISRISENSEPPSST
jgi:hypothetical protein